MKGSVDVGRIAIGVGLVGWGLFLLFGWRWQASDDARLRKIYERNWWLDKRRRRIRRGQLSKEEWLDQCVRWHRTLGKWVGTPVILLYLAAAGWMIVQGIKG
jgi:hypothetical protein